MTQQEAMELAKRIVKRVVIECGAITPRNQVVEDISDALFNLSLHPAPPDGHVRFPDGRDLKVLGWLKFTADGLVIGDGAKVWAVADNYRDGIAVYGLTAHVDMGELDHPEVFSDPVPAAEAAKVIQAKKDAALRSAAEAAKGGE